MEEQLNTAKTLREVKRTKKIYAILAVVIFVVLVAAIFKTTLSNDKKAKIAQAPPVAIVHITPQGFEPATITVHPGTKVIWTNTENSLHQVASNPYPKDNGLLGLKSEILNNAQTYTYTANMVGSFGYHDQLQPTINGTLVVRN